MTTLTPQQMRELAEDNDVANTVTRGLTLVQRRILAGESARALRAAADQLEAVRRLVKRSGRHLGMNGEYYTVPMRDLDAILAADTAPQEAEQ